MTELSYRTALIVGSGAGLSASLARTFTRAGMTVALAARGATELAQLAKEVGGKAFACDASKRVEVIKLFADVEATFGAPDVVVYNASYRTRGPFVEIDPADVEKALAVSLWWLPGGRSRKVCKPHTPTQVFSLVPAAEVPHLLGKC